MKKALPIALFLWVVFYSTATLAMVFPGNSWSTATPEFQGVDSTLLAEAIDYMENLPAEDGSTELVIVRNGYVIWQGTNVDNQHGVWSLTKSIVSTLFGLLVDDQVVSLTTLAKNIDSNLASNYPTVTMRHFLTMTSGYRAIGDEPVGDYAHGPSETPFDPDLPLFTPPGSQFAYWDSAANEFGLLVTKVAGKSMETLFQERIGQAIGLDPDAWDWGDYGEIDGLTINGAAGNGGNHIFISAIELARFGHLLLNRGNWNGEQVISSDWIDTATSVHVPANLPWYGIGSDGRGVYGYLWWCNGILPSGTLIWPGATSGTYAAWGYNNNILCIVPELNMVIVRLGLDAGDYTIQDEDWGQFLGLIGQAVTENPPTCALGSRFDETVLSEGMKYYTDRDYTLTDVPPAYIGLDAILTPNDDRNLTTPSDYLTFTMPMDGMVYVAYDSRATSLPTWLSGFSDTGDRIYTSLSTQPYLRVYRRSYSSGACVNLGGNKAPGFVGSTVSNYLVFF